MQPPHWVNQDKGQLTNHFSIFEYYLLLAGFHGDTTKRRLVTAGAIVKGLDLNFIEKFSLKWIDWPNKAHGMRMSIFRDIWWRAN
ncbi:hypothetical protein GCM10011450_27610 [Advenella faeciporci]|uniref:Uncharacterized protein n=1 Tax=Advenella faeciporci TaxID=797535 RepID=A0A918JRY5_9BURK|nr:hypothetical protein GCM10011450_27610 [Advenella faeciporci]